MLASNVSRSITSRATRSTGASRQVSMTRQRHTYIATRQMKLHRSGHSADFAGPARDVVHAQICGTRTQAGRQAGRDNFKINNQDDKGANRLRKFILVWLGASLVLIELLFN